jgi:hypothetical protein
VALAYAAAHPERIFSLAPSTSRPRTSQRPTLRTLNGRDLKRLRGSQNRSPCAGSSRYSCQPGVDPPEPSVGPPPPWMATRPAGIRAFLAAIRRHRVESASYAVFERPVYYSFGSLSNRRWVAMKDRLARTFPDFEAERYEGLHHLHTSHQAEPERVAQRLLEIWSRAERRTTN